MSGFEQRISGGHPRELAKIEALWKALCAAFTEALGKPTAKKSMSRSWDGVRCWYFVSSAGLSWTLHYTVVV